MERLIYNITNYIVENGYVLIDVTGQPTTWLLSFSALMQPLACLLISERGKWSPKYLNNNESWYDERGVNAMQLLSYLVSAYRITKNEKYAISLALCSFDFSSPSLPLHHYLPSSSISVAFLLSRVLITQTLVLYRIHQRTKTNKNVVTHTHTHTHTHTRTRD